MTEEQAITDAYFSIVGNLFTEMLASLAVEEVSKDTDAECLGRFKKGLVLARKAKDMAVDVVKSDDKKLESWQMIEVSKKEYFSLRCAEIKLQMLENAGVDNWEWYDVALDPGEDKSYGTLCK